MQRNRPGVADADGTAPSTHRLAIAAAAAAGGLLAVQTRINGELGARLGDGLVAALIAFTTGLVLIVVGLLAHGGARERLRSIPPLVRSGALPGWTLLGGAVGSSFVISQGLVAAALGTALFTVAAVAGQAVSGLVLDRVGVGPGGSQAVTTRRLVGTLLCLVAVALSVSSRLESDIAWWAIVLPLVGGAALAWQQAANGRVRAGTGSVVVATAVNFAAGTVVVAVVTVAHGLVTGFPAAFPTDPWLYLGGVSAIVFVAATAALVHRTGVLLLGLAIIAGQLVTSLVLDLFSAEDVVDRLTVAGTALALVAVLVTGSRTRARTAAVEQRVHSTSRA